MVRKEIQFLIDRVNQKNDLENDLKNNQNFSAPSYKDICSAALLPLLMSSEDLKNDSSLSTCLRTDSFLAHAMN